MGIAEVHSANHTTTRCIGVICQKKHFSLARRTTSHGEDRIWCKSKTHPSPERVRVLSRGPADSHGGGRGADRRI